jgi:uncharacterized protein YwgA
MKPEAIKQIVDASGGKINGKTRLQKTAYLMEAWGLGYGFDFSYHYYGPYSEDLAIAAQDALALGLIEALPERPSGRLVYSVTEPSHSEADSDAALQSRQRFLTKLAAYDTTTLELAATVDFLEKTGFKTDPWAETKRRKSVKATDERINKAKHLLEDLRR